MTDAPDSTPVTRFDWERLLRRADMPGELKYLGLMMATYASKDGGSIRPGDERLSAATGKGVRTIERNRREIERRGWITQTKRRWRGEAAEYHLTVPLDLLDDPRTADPDDHRRADS